MPNVQLKDVLMLLSLLFSAIAILLYSTSLLELSKRKTIERENKQFIIGYFGLALHFLSLVCMIAAVQ